MQNYFKTITRPWDKSAKPKTNKPHTLSVETEYKQLKKLLTHKTHNIANKLKISFTQPKETYGWIYLIVETEISAVKIRCSYAFEPFDNFIFWMESILFDKSLFAWDIEEEGRNKKLFVYPVDTLYLRFIVLAQEYETLEHMFEKYDSNSSIDRTEYENASVNSKYKEHDIIIDTVVKKEELIAQFYYAFKNFVKNNFDQKRWSDENLYKRLEQLNRHFDCNWDRWRGINS